jgi:poly(A) polymerase
VEYATGLELPTFVVRDLPRDDAGLTDVTTSSDAVEPAADNRLEPARHAVNLDELCLDDDAAKVVRRLTRHGYEAYLVGGCVRDLLLGRHPKDFDVATNAPPDGVRRLFKNSRIIGRRFRLVHVLFGGGKVIETATFRRAPRQDDEAEGADLLIRSDNEFGRAHEDACRRDFTINGLFYDLERREVLDWVNGMPDIACHTVNTIGPPVLRFLEDPIRMLRAIKFAARLDFGIHPDVYDAIVQCRESLAMAARPRLFEEVWRLLREGAAHRALWLAWEVGVLDVLLPELSAFLADEPDSGGLTWRALAVVDQQVRSQKQAPSDVVLWFTLLAEPLLEVCAGKRDRMVAASRFLEPIIDRLNLPRRIADCIRRVAAVLPRLEAGRIGRLNRGALWNDLQQIQRIRRLAQDWPASMPEHNDSDVVLSDSPPRGTRRRSKTRDAAAKQ